MVGKGEQPARDGVARGFRARTEEQAEEQVQLHFRKEGRREPVPVVHRRIRDNRQHVVGRLGPLRGDQLLAVAVHPRPGLLDRHLRDGCLAGAAEVELRLDGLEQPMPFGFRNSQQNADHLHRQLRSDVDHEVERLPRLNGIQQPPGAGTEIVLDTADHPWRQAGADQSADLRMPRVVHHVEHLSGDRKVLQQRPTEWALAAGHRRVRLRITKHRKGFGMSGHRPEALAVRGVVGGLMPVHRRLAAMHFEQVVRETVGEIVQIGEVDSRQCHRIAPEVYFAASG